MPKQILKIILFLAILLLIPDFIQAAVPSQFADLTSCQLSTNPAILTSTCNDVPAINISIPDLYDGTEATKYNSLFGASYFRISTPVGLTGSPVSMYPDYAKVPVWNADGSKLLILSNSGWWHLFDGETYQWIRRLEHPANYFNDGIDLEPRWSNANADVFYYRSNMTLYSYSVASNSSSMVHIFTDAEFGTTGCTTIRNGDEGNQDDSDRYWVFWCQNGSPNYSPLAIAVYDKTVDAVLSHKNFEVNGMCGTDACPSGANWVGMDHSGNNVVIQWNTWGSNGVMVGERGKGTEVFDKSLNFVSKISEQISHSDMAQTEDGTDVYIGSANVTAINGYNAIRVVRLSDGIFLRSCMIPLLYTHISGRTNKNIFKGWVLISTYDQWGSGLGIDSPGGLFAVENFALDVDTCEVRRIAHTQSNWNGWKSARTNSTAYTDGTINNWSTGTSQWKVITAGTTGASAPDITGKVVGDIVTDGTVVWQMWATINGNYYSEPHSSMNFDFTKIIWGSNWRDQSAEVQTYVSELPSDVTPPSSPSGLNVL